MQPDSASRHAFSLPPLTLRGTLAHHPYLGPFYAGFHDWALHPGLNGAVSASAMFGLGRHGGSGFANSVALMFADTLTSRLSFAVGGYYTNLDWNGHRTSNAGLSALLSYRFDDHWEAAVFAQKSLTAPRVPMPMYWAEDLGDKIGASVRYNVNPAFSIGVSVWSQSLPERPGAYGPPAMRR